MSRCVVLVEWSEGEEVGVVERIFLGEGRSMVGTYESLGRLDSLQAAKMRNVISVAI
jgi:hypothetical protein